MKILFFLLSLLKCDTVTIYDQDQPTHPDPRPRNPTKSKSAPLLSCGSNKITIVFDAAEIRKSSMKVENQTQIFFRGFENCHSQQKGDKYLMTLFFPFTSCGTNVVHDTEDFVYTNEVVMKTKDEYVITLLQFRCVYEDKYTVSYEHGLKPIERTLQFHTQMGSFEVDMEMYDGSEYGPAEKLQEGGGVYLNERIYLQLTMFDPLQRNEIVLSVQSCYATDSPDFTQMNVFHYLMSSMCAHPGDSTVQIHSNGVSDKARFSFNMFRFTESFSYIYLHCEVRICNKTSEVCVGEGSLCNGNYDEYRSRREAVHLLQRNERSAYIPLAEDTQKFISRGPILAYAKDDAGQGEYTVNAIFLDAHNEVATFGIPKLFIFGTVASGLVFGVVVGLTLIVCKHKKQADEREKEINEYDQIRPRHVRTVYGDLMLGCKPVALDRRLPRCMPN